MSRCSYDYNGAWLKLLLFINKNNVTYCDHRPSLPLPRLKWTRMSIIMQVRSQLRSTRSMEALGALSTLSPFSSSSPSSPSFSSSVQFTFHFFCQFFRYCRRPLITIWVWICFIDNEPWSEIADRANVCDYFINTQLLQQTCNCFYWCNMIVIS